MYTDYFLAPRANAYRSDRLCSYCGEEVENFVCSCEGAKREVELKEEAKRIEVDILKIPKLSANEKEKVVLNRQILELQKELVRATIETKTPYDG